MARACLRACVCQASRVGGASFEETTPQAENGVQRLDTLTAGVPRSGETSIEIAEIPANPRCPQKDKPRPEDDAGGELRHRGCTGPQGGAGYILPSPRLERNLQREAEYPGFKPEYSQLQAAT